MSLESYIKDATLQRKLESVKAYATENLLRFWQIHAPHFVDHGESHSANIESLLIRIIPELVLSKMTEYEIFLLLCGAWLHDIGMISKVQGESDKEVRERHHIKSRQLIRKALPEIQLNDDERYIIGEIAFYHRKAEDVNNAIEIYETQLGSVVSRVHIKFLCALLRLADGCEIANSRSSRKLLEISDLDEETKFHHEAHLHVSAVNFDLVSKEILVSLRVQNEQDKQLLESFLKAELEKELLSVKDVLAKYGINYLSVKLITTIDAFAAIMPKPLITAGPMSLEEKLFAIEKKTGYYPSMVLDQGLMIHVYYETISETTKELQSEVMSVIKIMCELFYDKKQIILTLNKIHDYTGTNAPVESEIITAAFSMDDLNKVKTKADLWNKLRFFKRRVEDIQFNDKVPINWQLIP